MNKKRGVSLVFAVLLVFSLISLASAEKLALNSDEQINSLTGLVSVGNLHIGDIFYLSDGKKARVTGIEDAADD